MQVADIHAPHGHIRGTITLPFMLGIVPAGVPRDMLPHHPAADPSPQVLYKLEILDNHLIEYEILPGDVVLLDSSMIGYWCDRDFHGETVAVETHCGIIVGEFIAGIGRQPDYLRLLDGSDRLVHRTPEMSFLGTVYLRFREPGSCWKGDTFL